MYWRDIIMTTLEKMLKKQDELNILVAGDNWKEKGFRWDIAILQEGAELIDSTPWKWWKSGSFDLENIKIEIVDILHFVLSIALEEGIDNIESIENAMKKEASGINKYDMIVDSTSELIVSTLEGMSPEKLLFLISSISGNAGMTYDDMAKLFFGKSVLNEFRQKNGYKTGEYIKNWNGKEDNEAMIELALRVKSTNPDDIEKELYSLLEEEYKKVKDANRKDK